MAGPTACRLKHRSVVQTIANLLYPYCSYHRSTIGTDLYDILANKIPYFRHITAIGTFMWSQSKKTADISQNHWKISHDASFLSSLSELEIVIMETTKLASWQRPVSNDTTDVIVSLCSFITIPGGNHEEIQILWSLAAHGLSCSRFCVWLCFVWLY